MQANRVQKKSIYTLIDMDIGLEKRANIFKQIEINLNIISQIFCPFGNSQGINDRNYKILQNSKCVIF